VAISKRVRARAGTAVRAAALFAAASLAACGITGNFRAHPGFARLGSIDQGDVDRQLGISLGPLPLMVARRLTADDPELGAMLRGVKGVRVYVYDVNGDAARVRGRMERSQARLVADGWTPAVAMRDDGEYAAALVRTDARDGVRGIVVLTLDDEEAVLVNVIGRLRPESFSRVMASLGEDLPPMRVTLDDAPPPETGAGSAGDAQRSL